MRRSGWLLAYQTVEEAMTVLAFPRMIGRAPQVSGLIRRAEILALAKSYNLDPGARARFLRRNSIAGQSMCIGLSERAEIINALKRHIHCDSYVRKNRPSWAFPPGHRDELLGALVAEMRQERKARHANR
jgi:hypothetical protein